LKGESVEYLLGALPTAIEIANQHKSAILVLEELNALSPQMQKVLNQLLDWRRHVYIPELSKTYRLNNGIKLLIAATMNPSTYGGVFELNEDLKSRFAEYFIGYPETDTEKKILSVNELDEELVKKLTLLAYETRKSTELSYALSPRDLALFTQLYISYKRLFTEAEALKYALKVTMVNRYQDVQERRTIEERIKSIFGEVL
jgi:MoxR-like ATPase